MVSKIGFGQCLPSGSLFWEFSYLRTDVSVLKWDLYLIIFASDSSETLSQLVQLGVDLSKVELIPGAADMLIKMNFKTDIEPMLWLLSDIGFTPKNMTRLLTAFPKLLKVRWLALVINWWLHLAYS